MPINHSMSIKANRNRTLATSQSPSYLGGELEAVGVPHMQADEGAHPLDGVRPLPRLGAQRTGGLWMYS
jgi:hypothetical protein